MISLEFFGDIQSRKGLWTCDESLCGWMLIFLFFVSVVRLAIPQ